MSTPPRQANARQRPASPCASHLIKAAQSAAPELQIFEPVGFVERYLVDKLEWERTADSVAVHVPCSSKKLGLGPSFHRLAGTVSYTHLTLPTILLV